MDIKKTLINGLDGYQAKLDKAETDAKVKRARTGKGQGQGASAEPDRVSLSSEAKLRPLAKQVAMETDDVRAEKVAALKAQVENGTYQIDVRKTAENLIKEDLDLLY